jgi:hypothetical protein
MHGPPRFRIGGLFNWNFSFIFNRSKVIQAGFDLAEGSKIGFQGTQKWEFGEFFTLIGLNELLYEINPRKATSLRNTRRLTYRHRPI